MEMNGWKEEGMNGHPTGWAPWRMGAQINGFKDGWRDTVLVAWLQGRKGSFTSRSKKISQRRELGS